MRWLAAAVAISMGALSVPAQASDELSAGSAPLDNAMLAMMTGGAAASFQFGGAGAQSVDLTASSALQASLSHSQSSLGGALRTGDIALGDVSGAMGGVTSIQLSTGFNNVQQSSAALAFAF
jgi:hypothetical protein